MDWYLTFSGQGEEREARDAIQRNTSTSLGAPLRLFILGIGNTVSSGVCEAIARAGGGKYLLAVSQESILLQCTGLLRAGKTSTITDVSVDWTAETSPGRGPFPHPLVQQSPPETLVPELYPSSRSVYFAIMPANTAPKQVVIRGKANGTDVLIRVDVESMKFGRKLSEPPFIHTLAAHRLIRDLEEGDTKGKGSETAQRREIIRLGKYYQLASSHTSFVAVDRGEVNPHPRNQRGSLNSPTTAASLVGATWQYLVNFAALFRSPTASSPPERWRSNGLPGGWATPDSADAGTPSQSSTEYSDGSEGDDDDDWASQHSDNSLSTLSSLESYSSIEIVPRPRRPRQDHDPSSQIPYAPHPSATSTTDGTGERFKPLPISPNIPALVQQMSTSGSFALTDALGALVGMDALEKARSWGGGELAATALAMAYLEENLGDHLEVCQLLMEKGLEFVRNHPNGGEFGEMLGRAREIFRPRAAW
jgi:hypothetical protein